MTIICCCDDACLLACAKRRNDVLATLCGLETAPYVVEAAVRVQAAARGRRLRRDKRAVDEAAALLTRLARGLLARVQPRRVRDAVRRVQGLARGAQVRRRPEVALLNKLALERAHAQSLELLVLRLLQKPPSPATLVL